ncbi:MAG: hypothetical protein LBK52_04495, partial [Deltaproteobacteria bacterium]|nr:hypothetical protein [Deltaproteobacteria bacterium]
MRTFLKTLFGCHEAASVSSENSSGSFSVRPIIFAFIILFSLLFRPSSPAYAQTFNEAEKSLLI